jgi:hypothetical protein
MVAITKPNENGETKIVISHYICDLCGASNENCIFPEEGNWSCHDDITNIVLITHEYENWETKDFSSTIFDLCPTCYKEKLVPWMNEQKKNTV